MTFMSFSACIHMVGVILETGQIPPEEGGRGRSNHWSIHLGPESLSHRKRSTTIRCIIHNLANAVDFAHVSHRKRQVVDVDVRASDLLAWQQILFSSMTWQTMI